MHEYDAALKLLLQASTGSILKQVSGLSVTRWLNAEMQQVQVSRADLVGATSDDQILHVELQSTNDPKMALRMAEYCLRIYRQFGRFPKQIVLYVGEAKLGMKDTLRGGDPSRPDFAFQYTLLDFRDLDGAVLLASDHVEENLLAILAQLRDQGDAIRQILARIASLEEPVRHVAFAQFLIISGLRRLGQTIKEEAQRMPILNDILDHDLLGPAILQGRQEGLQEGQQKIVRIILDKRLGVIPEWVEARLRILSAGELDAIAKRALDTESFEDLFPSV